MDTEKQQIRAKGMYRDFVDYYEGENNLMSKSTIDIIKKKQKQFDLSETGLDRFLYSEKQQSFHYEPSLMHYKIGGGYFIVTEKGEYRGVADKFGHDVKYYMNETNTVLSFSDIIVFWQEYLILYRSS